MLAPIFEVFQLFDTNSGLIPNDLYFELFLPSIKKISQAVREEGVPFIYFPKGIGVMTNPEAIVRDHFVDLKRNLIKMLFQVVNANR